jgi:hypothetical protein
MPIRAQSGRLACDGLASPFAHYRITRDARTGPLPKQPGAARGISPVGPGGVRISPMALQGSEQHPRGTRPLGTGGHQERRRPPGALVNNLGIECGKPFTLKLTEVPNLAPISTIDAARSSRGTDYEVAVGYVIKGPEATSVLARFSMAAVIVRDGTVVGFAAGRPLPGSLEEDNGTVAILRLHMPRLMNCSGPDTRRSVRDVQRRGQDR